MTLDELNGLPAAEAEKALLRCCGSQRWARTMAELRPFASLEELQKSAEEQWWNLKYHDWLQAFSHHPRIGEHSGSRGFAKQEQSGTSGASAQTLKELERLNRVYEEKFGHVFLIFATGKSAQEMLDALQARLVNGANVELTNAATEQAKITRLRLEKLIT